MSNFIIDPNMGFPNPIPGQDPGPDYSNNIQTSLTVIGFHDHTSGKGIPIPVAGLNINADLPLNNNNLTFVKTVRFGALLSPLAGSSPNLGCLYVAGNELYYNDESGNVLQITLNGSVNAGAGSISGLPSGTASASFSTDTFIWQSQTNTGANMDFASAVFRNLTANSKGLTLSPPNAMGADYSVTLPPPNSSGGTAFATYDVSNNLGVGPAVANGITASNIANQTITATQIANNTITQQQLATSVGTVPTGVVSMYGGVSAPTGYLICDGSSILRASFPDLFTAIGTAYGTADGTHFNIPDMRGYFPRGVDSGAGHDPDAGSRTALNPGGNTGDNVGSFESDQFASHTHGVGFATLGGIGTLTTGSTTASRNQTETSDAAGGNETRPKNVYFNFIIKT